MKLDVKALGLAMGIIWSLCTLIVGLTAMMFDWGTQWVYVLSSFYVGYKATVLGSIIGGIWAFADGFIGGVVIAWLYNKLAK